MNKPLWKGRFTVLAVSLSLILSSFAETIDVTTLGAKNDGSEDVSAIVNANTEKGALFFPAGVYKVSHPLIIKNSIYGAGYARTSVVNSSRTWLVSEMACFHGTEGVVEVHGDDARARISINIESLNIRCASRELGIRIGSEGGKKVPYVFIDKVGIFDVGACGLCVNGGGSRVVFAGNMTISGTRKDPTARAVGIRVQGAPDCRFSNIEVMGTCIGMELLGGGTYGDNLHLWTGIMCPHDPNWWHDTRGIVLGPTAHFTGSEIFPDTCYHAFDLRGAGSICEISNIKYWEDGSVKMVKDRTGAFVRYADERALGNLVFRGGLIGVGGDDAHPGATKTHYMPKAVVRDVILKSNYAIKGTNIDRLCLGRDLPDYTVQYADVGWCKVADIFTVAKSGACEGVLSLDCGAAWRIAFVKGASGRTDFSATPLNSVCGTRKVKMVEEDGVAKVFVRSLSDEPMEARFTTSYMCDYFRPLDHASLRNKAGWPRYRDVRKSL